MDIFISMSKYISKMLREALLDEDYPASFNMEEFKSLKSFRQRILYCQQHLTRLSSGSTRIVYKIDDHKVLKLAKNKRGLEQNYVESYIGYSKNYGDIVADIIDAHPDDLWLEMELARPVKHKDIVNYFGQPLEVIVNYLQHFYFTTIKNSPGHAYFYELDDEVKAHLDENDFLYDVKKLMVDNDVDPSDFGKRSSYGYVIRNGESKLVFIDYGITSEVMANYYSVN
jgi:hypothetical protein